MAIHSNFPLSINDQADVIRMFLEFMSEAHRAGRVSEAPTTSSLPGPRNASQDSRFPSELLDLD